MGRPLPVRFTHNESIIRTLKISISELKSLEWDIPLTIESLEREILRLEAKNIARFSDCAALKGKEGLQRKLPIYFESFIQNLMGREVLRLTYLRHSKMVDSFYLTAMATGLGLPRSLCRLSKSFKSFKIFNIFLYPQSLRRKRQVPLFWSQSKPANQSLSSTITPLREFKTEEKANTQARMQQSSASNQTFDIKSLAEGHSSCGAIFFWIWWCGFSRLQIYIHQRLPCLE